MCLWQYVRVHAMDMRERFSPLMSRAGFIITDGDELYHTRWDNREGKHTIHAPFSILEVQEVNEKALKDPDTAVVDGEWLLRMRIKNDDFATLLNEDEYAKHCDSLAPEGW